jgi:hypothetical protein
MCRTRSRGRTTSAVIRQECAGSEIRVISDPGFMRSMVESERISVRRSDLLTTIALRHLSYDCLKVRRLAYRAIRGKSQATIAMGHYHTSIRGAYPMDRPASTSLDQNGISNMTNAAMGAYEGSTNCIKLTRGGLATRTRCLNNDFLNARVGEPSR